MPADKHIGTQGWVTIIGAFFLGVTQVVVLVLSIQGNSKSDIIHEAVNSGTIKAKADREEEFRQLLKVVERERFAAGEEATRKMLEAQQAAATEAARKAVEGKTK